MVRRVGVRLPEQLRSKIAFFVPGGCWLWTACKNTDGYALVCFQRKVRTAHRLIYEMLVGEIPEGMSLDHLCRVRHCVNPEHLEPCPLRENILRSPVQLSAVNASRDACKHGHRFTPENTVVRNRKQRNNPSRQCLTCQRNRSRISA